MGLRVTRPVLDRMLAEAASAAPDECCGILLGCGALVDNLRPADNVARNPQRYFEIEPQALVDAHRAARNGGAQVVGYYHSHLGGPAAPSAVDRSQSAGDGSLWAIIGESDVTFWRDGKGGFAALSYIVTDR